MNAELSTQMGNISSAITTFGNTVTKSLSSLMPGASAVSAGITAQEAANNTAENCVYLDSIGAVGDAFCNPYFITDSSTIEDHPADIVNKVADLGGFENDKEEEVPTIKEDSNLAKYIIYCGQRQSPFGMADQNIASAITSGTSTGNMVGDSLVGATPVVGDFIGILEHKNNSASSKLLPKRVSTTQLRNIIKNTAPEPSAVFKIRENNNYGTITTPLFPNNDSEPSR